MKRQGAVAVQVRVRCCTLGEGWWGLAAERGVAMWYLREPRTKRQSQYQEHRDKLSRLE